MMLTRYFQKRMKGPIFTGFQFFNDDEVSSLTLRDDHWEALGSPDTVTVVVMPDTVTSHVPVAGDSVERWLVAHRDKYPHGSTNWGVVDVMLDNYRTCAMNDMSLAQMTELLGLG